MNIYLKQINFTWMSTLPAYKYDFVCMFDIQYTNKLNCSSGLIGHVEKIIKITNVTENPWIYVK